MNFNDSVLVNKRVQADKKAIELIFQRTNIQLNSIWDLVNSREKYASIIPVLIDLLKMDFEDDGYTKEGIVRALAVKEARGIATKPLIELFEASDNLDLKWVIGNTLSVIATPEYFDDLERIWGNARHGKSRQMIAYALAKTKNPEAIYPLMEGLRDVEIQGHAVVGLFKLGDSRARGSLEPFTRHEKTWIRNYAKKALEKFDS